MDVFSGEGTRPHVFSQGNADFNKGETRSQPKTISGKTLLYPVVHPQVRDNLEQGCQT